MQYYSTNRKTQKASLYQAVVKGLAPDRGLYMPETIPALPRAFFNNIAGMSLTDISYVVANTLFGQDIPSETLRNIVSETFNFDIPLVKVSDNIYSLELFHGPTLAFKDVGARFMARVLAHFNHADRDINVLVATSGDTGSAVANGFLGVKGVKVYVLYPKGKVSDIQESQFTTLGNNITAIGVRGTFDDCQAMVKNAFLDPDLNKRMLLTSANSINVARFLPQSFYYFYAYAQLLNNEIDNPVVAVPSGNLGNLCAGLIAKRMGLPIKRFIAGNNRNDVFTEYLNSGIYTERKSIPTIANAMDVGAPSNFARILDLYKEDHSAITADISGISYTDTEIGNTILDTWKNHGYLADPHGAVGLRALNERLQPGETGIFLETAHPAKFLTTMENIIGEKVDVPQRLQNFMKGQKRVKLIPANFATFKKFLLEQN